MKAADAVPVLSPPPPRRKAIPGHWAVASSPEVDQMLQVKALMNALKVSEICARILVRRGMGSVQSADAFLSRRMDLLHDPNDLPDMPRAVARIAEAIEKQQKILLFGDYDADGITSTALLARFLKLIQRQRKKRFEFEATVPERKNGYGLSLAAVAGILARKPALVVTIDNGISAHDALASLAAHGIDCIVVDHHSPSPTLPPAIAVVNPKRRDNTYPFTELCGVGLAFKLAWALSVHYSQDKKVTPEFRAFLLDAMALAAIGTIADVVPLVGENRVLAYHGLAALGRTSSPGLRALLANCKVDGVPSGGEVSFRVAPRINAAGRCGQAADALELLLTDDPVRAGVLVALLEGHNTERQKIESHILEQARARAFLVLRETPGCRVLVFDSAEWHNGVIGIVASRLVDEFHRPALLLSIDAASNIAQGSGRSIRGLHLFDALAREQGHLLSFGGHAAAAGLKIDAAKIDLFKASFKENVSSILTDADLVRRLHIDEQVSLNQVSVQLCNELDRFEPCGAGNHRPMLAAFNVVLPAPPKLMGKEEKHLNFFARQEKTARRVVGFNCADRFNSLCDSAQGIDLAFRPQLNTFRGEMSVELIMEEFRAATP